MAGRAEAGFGGLLRRLRDEAGLTQDELAEAARVSQRAVSDLERGINRTARKDTAVLLADALKLTGLKRELFVAAARGRTDPADVLAAQGLAAEQQNNLPAQLSTFIGRDRELSAVRALVASSRLVTLTGAGGAGKTRLALRAASELLDGSGDGVWLVELAAVTDEDTVAAVIADALRIPEQPGRPALKVLADALGPQDMLIVLDNCEHLIGACAKTADELLRQCPKVHLIVTSREPLGIGGETIYRVPPLSLPLAGDSDAAAAASCDAVALFAARARDQGASLALDVDTISLAVSVCRRLDGMPLAIELAAARMRSMALAELADRLDQRFRLLTGGSRTALERQQTLRGAVDWSYSLLPTAEQVLLARLSVFAPGFDLAAAEAVAGSGGIDTQEVAGLLGSLVDRSMVVAEQGGAALRYRLLETIRLFAAERLTGADREEAAAAHCAHYLAVAETAAPQLAGPQLARWFGRLDADQANLRRAVEHAAGEPHGTRRVLRFGVALWRYWYVRSGEEAVRLLVPAVGRPEAASDPALFAEALVCAALLTVFTDMSTSLRLAERADQVASGLGDDRLLALSRAMLCAALHFAGQSERARPVGADSVRRARQSGDDVLLGVCLTGYAFAVGAAASGPLYAEGIACTERSGDLLFEQTFQNNAGWDALEMGNIPDARIHLEAAERVAEAIGNTNPATTVNLGQVLRAEHDLDAAQSTLREALRIGRRVGNKRTMAEAIQGLACLASDLGDWHRAAVLHGAAQSLHDQTGGRWGTLNARYRKESLEQARAALGNEQLQQAYARGIALSFDRAIDLAYEDSPAPNGRSAGSAPRI